VSRRAAVATSSSYCTVSPARARAYRVGEPLLPHGVAVPPELGQGPPRDLLAAAVGGDEECPIGLEAAPLVVEQQLELEGAVEDGAEARLAFGERHVGSAPVGDVGDDADHAQRLLAEALLDDAPAQHHDVPLPVLRARTGFDLEALGPPVQVVVDCLGDARQVVRVHDGRAELRDIGSRKVGRLVSEAGEDALGGLRLARAEVVFPDAVGTRRERLLEPLALREAGREVGTPREPERGGEQRTHAEAKDADHVRHVGIVQPLQ
jgi:hypothetical protein